MNKGALALPPVPVPCARSNFAIQQSSSMCPELGTQGSLLTPTNVDGITAKPQRLSEHDAACTHHKPRSECMAQAVRVTGIMHMSSEKPFLKA